MKKLITIVFFLILVTSTIQISGNNSMNNPLIISTYFGGINNDGMYYTGVNIIQDDLGNFIIAGSTESDDFPMIDNAYYNQNNGGSDIFIIKINNDLLKFYHLLISVEVIMKKQEELL